MTDCLIVQPIAASGLELLNGAGLSVHTPATTEFTSLEPHLATARAVITRNHGLSATEISAAPNLEVIVSHGAGTDAIDKTEAVARGIPVLSTPGANTIAVAEHTMALILACARQIPQADRATRGGDFDFRYRQTGFELAGKTLGLVGYGRIARKVASLAHAFAMHVMAVTRSVTDAELAGDGVEPVDMDTLCSRSDIVSLHTVPGRHDKFDAVRIGTLRRGAILVNTARGAILDEAALVVALRNGQLSSAALDVFASEPLPGDCPLFACPNLIVTPHVGGSAREALDRTAIAAARKVIEALGTVSR
ncbi:MAG: hydroxyacid dehydrogenase [Paracoccaceae bacterium]|nr:hydroxyacid dehydrogenase [Paracoccaceae bacterium]